MVRELKVLGGAHAPRQATGRNRPGVHPVPDKLWHLPLMGAALTDVLGDQRAVG